MFWAVFEQAGSTLNLFADRSTRNVAFGWEFPSSWWQSVERDAHLYSGALFAWLWVRLGKNDPSTPTKFAVGLIGVGWASWCSCLAHRLR
jgi:POT family proton-dependent oligopeptide transporter